MRPLFQRIEARAPVGLARPVPRLLPPGPYSARFLALLAASLGLGLGQLTAEPEPGNFASYLPPEANLVVEADDVTLVTEVFEKLNLPALPRSVVLPDSGPVAFGLWQVTEQFGFLQGPWAAIALRDQAPAGLPAQPTSGDAAYAVYGDTLLTVEQVLRASPPGWTDRNAWLELADAQTRWRNERAERAQTLRLAAGADWVKAVLGRGFQAPESWPRQAEEDVLPSWHAFLGIDSLEHAWVLARRDGLRTDLRIGLSAPRPTGWVEALLSEARTPVDPPAWLATAPEWFAASIDVAELHPLAREMLAPLQPMPLAIFEGLQAAAEKRSRISLEKDLLPLLDPLVVGWNLGAGTSWGYGIRIREPERFGSNLRLWLSSLLEPIGGMSATQESGGTCLSGPALESFLMTEEGPIRILLWQDWLLIAPPGWDPETAARQPSAATPAPDSRTWALWNRSEGSIELLAPPREAP